MTEPEIIGCLVTGEEKAKLEEICSPLDVSDVMKALVHSIISGDITITRKIKGGANE